MSGFVATVTNAGGVHVPWYITVLVWVTIAVFVARLVFK